MKTLLASAVIVGLFPAHMAYAQEPEYLTAYSLQQSCSTAQGSPAYGECLFYVLGFNDAVQGAAAVFPAGRLYCLASNVSIGQMVQVFVRYSYNHPEELNLPAGVIFTKSMRAAFRCAGT